MTARQRFVSKPKSDISSPAGTWALAKTARSKVVSAGNARDPNLRLLTAHANLYDKLLVQILQEQRERRREHEAMIEHLKSQSRTTYNANNRSKKDISRAKHPPRQSSPDTTKVPLKLCGGTGFITVRRPPSHRRHNAISISVAEVFSDGDESDDIDADNDTTDEESDNLSDETESEDEDEEEYIYMTAPIQSPYPPMPGGDGSIKMAHIVEMVRVLR